MSDGVTRPRKRHGLADELRRATARRGDLDAIYLELSDHWTSILQQMHPVWMLIGPGLSDPGHIEMRSRTVYLDSLELLGSDTDVKSGKVGQREVLRTFGVALHETYHAKHSKLWVLEHTNDLASSDDEADRTLGQDMNLLEEPRMEAHGVRNDPAGSKRAIFATRALRACAVDVLIPTFQRELAQALAATGTVTRDLAGWTMVYLQGRVPYGVLEDDHLAALRPVWTAALGVDDHDRVCDLIDRLVWVDDGDIDALAQISREYREIIGPPQKSPANSGSSGGGQDAGALADAIADAIEQIEAAIEDGKANDEILQEATQAGSAERSPTETIGHTHGPATGRVQDRGVNRAPYADERQAAQRYANALRRALTAGTVRIDKRTPGGRFNSRTFARQTAERQAGRPPTARPWEIERQARNPIRAPHVALLIDTSGSMYAHEGQLGPIVWMLTEGLRAVDGRVATVLFGDGCHLLSDGTRPLALVPGIECDGGHELVAQGLHIACEHLDMTDQRRPRFAYMVGDGHWVDRKAGVEKVRQLRQQGVTSVHIGIGEMPWAVEADRTICLTDPTAMLDQIARDTVDALRAAGRRPNTPARARR